MPPGAFWDMTQVQLVTLADQHQAAHHTGGRPTPSEPAGGESLLGFASMRRT
ncbi:hypothetical protein ACIGNW_00285 [Streptomyces sp. NPDC053707]|uniref:hypothetical protein n=1 Tax=Streptomyces sp. NPDC053707 TaxID=3365712 RepID=UPI0037D53250